MCYHVLSTEVPACLPASSSVLSFAFHRLKILRYRAGEEAQWLGMFAAPSGTQAPFLEPTYGLGAGQEMSFSFFPFLSLFLRGIRLGH